MLENTTSTVLSTIGTVIWCIQLSPQIYFLHKKKDAEGFPPIFMLLWCISGLFMCIYFVVSDSYVPMQVQPHLFTTLCSIAWVQSMYYPPHSYPKRKFLSYAATFYLCWIGLEVGFCVWLRPVYANGTHWEDLIFGILATVFLCVGLLPPYWELIHRNGRVVGINFLFLALDSSGAVFSMAAMCIGTFDAMGMILYAIMIAMELGLFVSQGIWLLRFRVLRKEKDTDPESDTQATDVELAGADDDEDVSNIHTEKGGVIVGGESPSLTLN